jgi:hypothetical protein
MWREWHIGIKMRVGQNHFLSFEDHGASPYCLLWALVSTAARRLARVGAVTGRGVVLSTGVRPTPRRATKCSEGQQAGRQSPLGR